MSGILALLALESRRPSWWRVRFESHHRRPRPAMSRGLPVDMGCFRQSDIHIKQCNKQTWQQPNDVRSSVISARPACLKPDATEMWIPKAGREDQPLRPCRNVVASSMNQERDAGVGDCAHRVTWTPCAQRTEFRRRSSLTPSPSRLCGVVVEMQCLVRATEEINHKLWHGGISVQPFPKLVVVMVALAHRASTGRTPDQRTLQVDRTKTEPPFFQANSPQKGAKQRRQREERIEKASEDVTIFTGDSSA